MILPIKGRETIGQIMHPLNPLSGNVLLICPALLFHSVSVVDVFGGVVARVPCSPSLCIIDDLLKIST